MPLEHGKCPKMNQNWVQIICWGFALLQFCLTFEIHRWVKPAMEFLQYPCGVVHCIHQHQLHPIHTKAYFQCCETHPIALAECRGKWRVHPLVCGDVSCWSSPSTSICSWRGDLKPPSMATCPEYGSCCGSCSSTRPDATFGLLIWGWTAQVDHQGDTSLVFDGPIQTPGSNRQGLL